VGGGAGGRDGGDRADQRERGAVGGFGVQADEDLVEQGAVHGAQATGARRASPGPMRPAAGAGDNRPMAPVKNLAHGEFVIFHARSHWKVLVLPFLVVVIAVAAALAILWAIPDASRKPWMTAAVAGVAALVIVVFALPPFIRWLARTDTLTNYRLISREGVFRRVGRDIPMDRVHAVSYDKTLLERFLGAGTLTVQTAADASDVVLEDVAHVERRALQIQEELLDVDFPDVAPDPGPQAPPQR
jgi:membrane protein YdbS with pleckstrin-like domain